VRYLEDVIYVTVETVVRRRPEIVWEFLTDVSAIATWAEGVVLATIAGDVKRGVGLEVEIVGQAGPGRRRATCEVTAWREPELLALETRVPGMLRLDRAVLERVAEGTRLGVYGEIATQDKLSELFARSQGMLGGGAADVPLQGVYERSVSALVKRIEAFSALPYR
jgi:uncharacterized protein YndB with AHSA1/START domain